MQNEKIDLIGAIIPRDLIISAEVINSGFNSDAIIVNNEWIFRFPKRPEIYDEYIREEKILKLITPYLDIPVPNPTVHKINGELFTGHRLIKGKQYTDAVAEMSKAQKDQLARDLAEFLVQLHGIKTDLPVNQYSLDEFSALKNVKSSLKQDAAQIKKILSDFAAKNLLLDPKNAVLCHTDLNENNILIEDGRLCGVIDFGGASVCERSIDFAALTKFDYELAKNMVQYYTEISGNAVDFDYSVIIEKMICYNGIVEACNDIERQKRYRKWLSRIK